MRAVRARSRVVAGIFGCAAVVLVVVGTPPSAIAEPLAEVNGEAITAEDVDKAIRPQLSKLEEQLYNLKRQRVEALVRDRLLAQEAKRRGISVQALLDREVTSKVGLVTEEEIEQFYQANKSRVAGDEAEARDKIRAALQGQKLGAKREEFVSALRSKAKVVMHLHAPPVVRAEVGVDGAPTKGSAKAPVTIVPLRLPRLSDRAAPSGRDEGGRGGAVRDGAGQVLAVSRRPLSEGAEDGAGAEGLGRRGRARRREVRDLRHVSQARAGGAEGHPGRLAARRQRHAGVLRQRAHDLGRAARRGVRADHRRRALAGEIAGSYSRYNAIFIARAALANRSS